MNIERLTILRDYLLTIAPEMQARLDMSTFAGSEECPWRGQKDLSCGTKFCIAGLATSIPALSKAGLHLTTWKEVNEDDEIEEVNAGIAFYSASGLYYDGFDALSKFFGLDGPTTQRLFGIAAYGTNNPNFSEVIDRLNAIMLGETI